MFPNAFIGRPTAPDDAALSAELGKSKALWDSLAAELAEGERPVTSSEWHSYSRKAGWSMRLKRGKRTLLHLLPHRGTFGVAFVFGAAAIQAIRQARFPRKLLEILDSAPRYPEGTSIRFEVTNRHDLGLVRQLVGIKLDT